MATAEKNPTNAVDFKDWHTTRTEEPTEAEEGAAREKTLSIGNVTEVDYDSDSGERGDFYSRLDKHNRDNAWRNREDSLIWKSYDEQFKRKALLAVAHQLSLSPVQRQMALDRLLALDLPRCGHSTEVMAFCVCALVVNEDVEKNLGREKPYHPARNQENNCSAYAKFHAQIIDRGEASQSVLQSVYAKLRQESLPRRNGAHSRQSLTQSVDAQRQPAYRLVMEEGAMNNIPVRGQRQSTYKVEWTVT